jgi:arabinogalactan endo-1,4-beta-galactosidase
VILAAAHAFLLLPHCAGDTTVIHPPDGDAGEAGSDSGASGGASGRGGASGKGGRGGSSNAGRGGSAGSSAGESAAGETSGGESSVGGTGAAGGVPAEGGAGSGGVPVSGSAGVGGGDDSGGAPSSGAGGAAGENAGGEAGAPGPTLRPDFILGADISSVDELIDQGATFVDTDGQTKSIFGVLAAHGFNYIRLRTFVAPWNLYGYANPNGDAEYLRDEPYCDRDHTASFGRQAKDAGMKLLVDLHYSDNWADPGKQMIPEAWRDVQSIEELGVEVRTYTQDLVQYLVDQGARPDIVQLGNEIHPGMLYHVPGENPVADPWGNMDDKEINPINGLVSDWTNLGLLLREGVAGVQAVDPSIRIMLHLANTTSPNAITGYINSARTAGVDFDILGLSCYTEWHGTPTFWQNTFNTLASRFTDLDFVIAEYGPEARRANEIIRDLPDQRGLGTFVWEPTQSGTWGPSMFSQAGNEYTALTDAFAVYDGIREDFGMP